MFDFSTKPISFYNLVLKYGKKSISMVKKKKKKWWVLSVPVHVRHTVALDVCIVHLVGVSLSPTSCNMTVWEHKIKLKKSFVPLRPHHKVPVFYIQRTFEFNSTFLESKLKTIQFSKDQNKCLTAIFIILWSNHQSTEHETNVDKIPSLKF